MPTANPDWIPGPAPRPRRRRRLGRSLLILLALLIAPIAGCRTWDALETRWFWREIDEIEARGERLQPDVPAPVTDDQLQASRLYADAVRHAMADRARFQQMGAAIQEIARAPDRSRHPRLAELRAFEQQYAAALENADRAAAADAGGAAPGDMNRLTGYEQSLDAVNAVRIARLAFEGEGDDAAAALLVTLRLRRGFPLVFGRWLMPRTTHSLHLVLSYGVPSDARLRELGEEYAYFASLQHVDDYLIQERARFLSMVMPEEYGGTAARRRIEAFEAVFATLLRPLMTRRLRGELEEFERAIEQSRTPWPSKLDVAQSAVDRAPRAQFRNRTLRRLLGGWVPRQATSALGTATPRMAANLVNAGAAATAIAIVRYRRARGALPSSLAELVPAYLPSAAIDPYSGGELRYVRTAGGFKVYSVGANKTDDGGTWEMVSDLHPSGGREPRDFGMMVDFTDSIPPGRSDASKDAVSDVSYPPHRQ